MAAAGGALVVIGAAVAAVDRVHVVVLRGVDAWNGPYVPPQSAGLVRTGLASEIVAVGALAVLVALLWRAAGAVAGWTRARPAATAVAVLTALWLPTIVLGRSAIFGGRRYWWLGDDAMIAMRYARNWADGLGLVWNEGERVEGYTNFLWTAFMAAVHAAAVPDRLTSLVVLLANLLIAAATIPYLVRMVRLLGGGGFAVGMTLVAFVLSKPIFVWGVSGFEATLLGLLVVVALVRILEDADRGRAAPTTVVIIAAVSLVRADALVLAALLYVVLVWLVPDRRRTVALIALSVVVPLAYHVARIAYYGDVLPNTAVLKTSHWGGRYEAGVVYAVDFVRRHVVFVGLAVLAAAAGTAARRAAGAVVAASIVYAVAAGGDAFSDFRFFVPLLPIVFALAALATEQLAATAAVRGGVAAVAILTMPTVVPGYAALAAPSGFDVGNVEIALTLDHEAPAGTAVADFWAGTVFYFADVRGIDLLGKTDPVIADQRPRSDGMLPGHNKFDFEHSLSLRPDVVVANLAVPVTEGELARRSVGPYAFTGLLFENETFRRHCLAQPVPVATWRTMFVCDWSPLQPAVDDWRLVRRS